MDILKTGLLASSIILLTNLCFWLTNQSQMMFYFFFDGTDWATHIFELWALDKYGFHNLVPEWYNGYKLFEFYYPGWNLFSLPLLKLSNDILVASFVSLLLLIGLIFIGIFLIGKTQKFSNLQVLAFFSFFAANALAISNFIRNGRTPELTAWAVFILLAAIIFYYKDKNLDYKFLAFIPLLSFLLLSHFVVSMLFGIFLLGFFITKSLKEKLYITLSCLTSIALISFWLWPLITGFNSTYVSTLNYSIRFYDNSLFGIMLNILLPLITLFVFSLYWKQKDFSLKELAFFIPTLVFGALLVFRLTPSIPLLDKIYPGPTAIFLTFFLFYFLFSLKIDKLQHKTILSWSLIILAVCSVTINVLDTNLLPERTDFQNEIINIIPNISGKYIVAGQGKEFLNWGIYTYAAIYQNKKTLWGGWQTTAYSEKYYNDAAEVYSLLVNAECENFAEKFTSLNGEEVLGVENICSTLKNCGFTEKISTKSACLYEIDI